MSDDFPVFPRGDLPDLPDLPDAPLEHQFSMASAIGCLGIGCVLVLVVIFALPLNDLGLPHWVQVLAPLVAFGLPMLGLWVLLTLPPAAPAHSSDPRHPLTGSGIHPFVERPARAGNRATLVAAWGLLLAGMAAVAIAAVPLQRDGIIIGAVAGAVVGFALVILGILVGTRTLPVPALRWVRMPIQSHRMRQGGPLALVGLALLAWGLFEAASLGYLWGYIGLPALIVVGVFAAPLTRQAPHTSTNRTPTRIPPIERE